MRHGHAFGRHQITHAIRSRCHSGCKQSAYLAAIMPAWEASKRAPVNRDLPFDRFGMYLQQEQANACETKKIVNCKVKETSIMHTFSFLYKKEVTLLFNAHYCTLLFNAQQPKIPENIKNYQVSYCLQQWLSLWTCKKADCAIKRQPTVMAIQMRRWVGCCGAGLQGIFKLLASICTCRDGRYMLQDVLWGHMRHNCKLPSFAGLPRMYKRKPQKDGT